ncbi:hypothetical protein KEM54_005759 [Ascosphaera aggregata]|nr:hypothetical protein KEM54_005759 [Ascosphaera aggregata]
MERALQTEKIPHQTPPNVREKPLYPELPQVIEEVGEGSEKQGNEEKPADKTQETPEQVTPQQKTPSKHSSLFIENEQTGQATPSFILRPQLRKSSGLGIDRQGLGSPKVAAILDRRGSIGDEAEMFSPAIPPSRGVRFDPREMEKEIEQEKQAEELARRSERDATSNLKDLIQSMSPKKKPAKMARKSLHIGSAVGLLGKRPVELDIDSDENEPTPKRLRGREASPVKSVRLPAPPSKDQTAGRLGPCLNLFPRSPGAGISTTPKGPPNLAPPSPLKNKSQKLSQDEPESTQEGSQQSESDVNYKPIRLQDFLEMTNIHFMELTTTKRRHTVAPKDKPRTSRDNPDKEVTFVDRVVAGATTLPLLEMYQHSCRELKNYISEGRNIIRSIEEETFAENPPLFREYLSAPPDVRALMDNQFRNVKTNARLQSKAMWYEWRMKLLDGLKQGLDKHVEDMEHDEAIISEQEKLVDNALPNLLEERSKLEDEVGKLRRKVEELQSVDREEILATRSKLVDADKRLASRREELEQTQAQLDEIADTVRSAAEMKADMLKEIEEGERLLAERRVCGLQEMRQLKASVRALEKKTGWCVLSTVGEPDYDVGPCMAMRYRGELKVTFYPKAFGDGSGLKFPLIEFEYLPGTSASGYEKVNPPPAKALIFSAMQRSLPSIASKDQSLTARDFLKGVARDWDRAMLLHDEIRYLQFCGVTRTRAVNESQIRVRCTLISSTDKGQQPPTSEDDRTTGESTYFPKSRTDIDFIVSPKVINDREIDVDVMVSAIAVYGVDTGKAEQMTEFLTRRVERSRDKASNAETGKVCWCDAIRQCEKTVM